MTLPHSRRAPAGHRVDAPGALVAPRRPGAPRWRFAVLALLTGAAWRLSAQSTTTAQPTVPPTAQPAVPPTAPPVAHPTVPQDPAVVEAARLDGELVDPAAAAERLAVPFGPGERLTYDVRFGVLKVGTGEMEVAGVTNVRGQESYHTRFRVRGGTFFYKVNDLFESWFNTRSLASLRFKLDQNEGKRDRERTYEIFPDRRTYREDDKPEQPSVADPLDEGSFLYYVRTLPLRDGDVYELNRYFRPDRNPVRIRVVRRERVKVPAGTFDAVVVQPTIRTRGIFSEGGRAEVWFSDDADRVVLQMKSQLSFGSLNLFLRNKQAGRRLTPSG
jgi:hypothetical protein